jgi:hypothetical protein
MQVLPPESSQQDVYVAAVKDVVEDVMAGYNGTVMAYGQTGTLANDATGRHTRSTSLTRHPQVLARRTRWATSSPTQSG